MKLISTYGMLLLLTLLVTSSSLPYPFPTCRVLPPSQSIFHLSPMQLDRQNPNIFFDGYNLDYKLTADAPDFVYLKPKRQLIQQQNIPIPNLISTKVAHHDNQWGNVISWLRSTSNGVIVQWGYLQDQLTNISNTILILNQREMQCFDSQVIQDRGILIIDCRQKLNFGYNDVLYYINLADQTIIPQIARMQPLIDYQSIKSRKIYHYRDPRTNFDYLIRAIFIAQQIQYSDNTYIQILNINKNKFYQPETLTVIDRSFLSLDSLRIMDFQIYDGRMFILDYDNGLYVVRITQSQLILIQGHFSMGKKSYKIGLFREQHDHLYCALATSSAIYEIDLSDGNRFMSKYDFLDGAYVSSIWLTRSHIIISTNAILDSNPYNTAIIFQRQKPANLYKTSDLLPFQTPNFFISIDPQNNRLLTIDSTSISIYQLNVPYLNIVPVDPSLVDKSVEFSLTATSLDPFKQQTVVCMMKYRLSIVGGDSMRIWGTGVEMPSSYYVNYPGQIIIGLDEYVRGANLQWKVNLQNNNNQYMDDTESKSFILKQNTSYFTFTQQFTPKQITHLHLILQNDQIYNFLQDTANKTYLMRCVSRQLSEQCPCIVQEPSQQGLKDQIYLSAHYQADDIIVAMFVTKEYPNIVQVYDFGEIDRFIIVGEDRKYPYAYYITDMHVAGRYMFVTMKYSKSIAVYDLIACIETTFEQCSALFTITSQQMITKGIPYFQPLTTKSTPNHPQLLFIQNIDSVIAITFDQYSYTVLQQIAIPDSKSNWKIEAVRDSLIVVTPPRSIDEYKVFREEKRSIILMKQLPIYGYQIMEDSEVKGQGDLVFITARLQLQENFGKDLDLGQSGMVMLIYKLGQPQVSSLYDIYPIKNQTKNSPLFQISQSQSQYHIILSTQNLTIFRQYSTPSLLLQNLKSPTKITLTYTNQKSQQQSLLTSVKINSLSQKIEPCQDIIDNPNFITDRILYKNKRMVVQMEDYGWWTGHVGNYTVVGCSECGGKIRVVEHLEGVGITVVPDQIQDAVSNQQGTYIQLYNSIAFLHPNNTIKNIMTLPITDRYELCTKIESSTINNFIISACYNMVKNGVNLYFTDLSAFKPLVRGPYYTPAQTIKKMKLQGNLLFILDSKQYIKDLDGDNAGVFIHAVNRRNLGSFQYLDLLDEINYLDIMSAGGYDLDDKLSIVDFDILHLINSNSYLLVLATAHQGIFYINFLWDTKRNDIQILRIQFLNIFKLLSQKNLTPPQTTIKSVVVSTIVTDVYDEIQLIVALEEFNVFRIVTVIDREGAVMSYWLKQMLKQYGPYTNSEMKLYKNYLAINQNLPISYYNTKYSKSIVSLYQLDTPTKQSPPSQQQIPTLYLTGSKDLNHLTKVFYFNQYQQPQPQLTLANTHQLLSYQINSNISLILDSKIGRFQKPSLSANNQFDSYKISFKIPMLRYQRVKGPRGYLIRKMKVDDVSGDRYAKMEEMLLEKKFSDYL